MNVLFTLTYYRPHISGLTIYVQRIAEALARRGHSVTIITSLYDTHLSHDEIINGIRIVRIPIAFRISKGVYMPRYTSVARRLIQESDICFVNLPSTPTEMISVPVQAKRACKPIVGIYHCDLRLPPGPANRFINAVLNMAEKYAAGKADRIVTGTMDYADSSPILTLFKHKLELIPPPICLRQPKAEEVEAFKIKYAPNGETLIGIAARFASEKGIEYLALALPDIKKHIPNAKVLFVGPCMDVFGEEKYRNRVMRLIEDIDGCWEFLGVLGDVMETFYAACDIIVLPSVNRTESFGLVQVESMLCGTPVVVSDLPGVRAPVRETGMGLLVTAGSSIKLADAIITVLQNRDVYVRAPEEIRRVYSFEKTVDLYIDLIDRLVRNGRYA